MVIASLLCPLAVLRARMLCIPSALLLVERLWAGFHKEPAMKWKPWVGPRKLVQFMPRSQHLFPPEHAWPSPALAQHTWEDAAPPVHPAACCLPHLPGQKFNAQLHDSPKGCFSSCPTQQLYFKKTGGSSSFPPLPMKVPSRKCYFCPTSAPQVSQSAFPEALIDLKALILSPHTSSLSSLSQRSQPADPSSTQSTFPCQALTFIPTFHPLPVQQSFPHILPALSSPHSHHRAGSFTGAGQNSVQAQSLVCRIRRCKGERCPCWCVRAWLEEGCTIPRCPPGASKLLLGSALLFCPLLWWPQLHRALWLFGIHFFCCFSEIAKCWHMLLINNKKKYVPKMGCQLCFARSGEDTTRKTGCVPPR